MPEDTKDKGSLIKRWFEEGKEFTMDLLKENERLRLLLATLKTDTGIQKKSVEVSNKSQTELEQSRVKEELDQLRETLKEVEGENKEFADEYVKIQQQSQNMASLYVASYRLHSTLNYDDVIDIINEIIINLIGSEVFAIFIKDQEKNSLFPVASEGIETSKIPPIKIGVGIAGQAAQKGQTYVAEKETEDENAPLACVPLKVQDDLLGMVVIYKLLRQKDGFAAVDLELFSLLADHAATAIYCSQLHAQSERKLSTMQDLLNLLKLEK